MTELPAAVPQEEMLAAIRTAAYAARYGEPIDTYTWDNVADTVLEAVQPYLAALQQRNERQAEEAQVMRNELAALIWQANGVTLTPEAGAAIATRLATTGLNICQIDTPEGRKLWLNP